MYLNLDLLYDINNYLYPLFYYEYAISGAMFLIVYSPIYKKWILKKHGNKDFYQYENFEFREKWAYLYTLKFERFTSFKLNEENLDFLKNFR